MSIAYYDNHYGFGGFISILLRVLIACCDMLPSKPGGARCLSTYSSSARSETTGRRRGGGENSKKEDD